MSDLACPSCSATDVLGHEVQGVYDGVLFWWCLQCGTRWQRFPEGDWRHTRTVELWAAWDKVEQKQARSTAERDRRGRAS